jgi:hypothetical protein
MTDNHEALAASRRLDSTTKAARVLAAINAITATGTPLNIAALARTAKVSRRFIYDHPELRAEAEQQAAGIAERDGIALTANARVTAAPEPPTSASRPSLPRSAVVSAATSAKTCSLKSSATRTPNSVR